MGPLRAPSHLSLERCVSSGQSLSTSHRATAAHSHGRGRRRSYRYVGVSPTPTECGLICTSNSASSPNWWTAPQKAGGGLADPACCVSSASQSAWRSSILVAHDLISVPLTEAQKKQSDDAARRLLSALQLSRTDSPVGRFLAERLPSMRSHPGHNPGSAILGQSSHADVAAAAVLLPILTWQWLSVMDLEGWVDRGVVQLLRETLLVQKAATDASASINELVGWCLDNCSVPAAALAALWGQQEAQSLPPRCRSFYGLMLQRLGLFDVLQTAQPQTTAADESTCGLGVRASYTEDGRTDQGDGGSDSYGLGVAGCSATTTPQQAMVLCSSVIRTALSTSSRSRSSEEELGEVDAYEDEEGPDSNSCSGECNGGDSIPVDSSTLGGTAAAGSDAGLDPNPDLVLLSKPLPAAARALLQQQQQQSGLKDADNAEQLQQQQQLFLVDGSSGNTGDSDSDSFASFVNGSSVGTKGTPGSVATPLEGVGGNGSGRASAQAVSSGAMTEATAAEVVLEAGTLSFEAVMALGFQASTDAAGEYPVGLSDGIAAAAGLADVVGATDGSPSPASPGIGTAGVRRIASLLQRPSRSPVAEPDLDPGAAAEGSSIGPEAGADGDGNIGANRRLEFRRGAAGPTQLYIAVRLVAAGQFPLRDLSGTVLEGGLAVPDTGPVVISNDPRVFPGTEAVLSDYVTAAGDKLAMRLEYIVDRSFYDEVKLQLFNISRVTRKRTDKCLIYVNGKAVNLGDPGCTLMPGDMVWFGDRSFCFRVEALRRPPSAVNEALRCFCDEATSMPGPEADPYTARRADTMDAGFVSESGETSSDELQYEMPSMSSTQLSSEPDMAGLSNLSRRNPLHAEVTLRRLAAVKPEDAAVWLIWAQTAARMEGPVWQAKARLLFRAAVDAARALEVVPPPPAALQVAAQRTFARGRDTLRRSVSTGVVAAGIAVGADDGTADSYSYYSASDGTTSMSLAATVAGGASPPVRHNWLLVQALGNWGKHEWRLRMYGSARHLFRTAVDEAAEHPDGVAGGGGGAILHYWASRELDALNVRNARIVVAEALRKCPRDVALYVLAAGVELEGGNLEMAKSYCQRAYALDRTDKQLFLVWPRVEAALGDRLKARLLYERALDMYPLNTKILNLYARFEAEEGSYREAAELYDRALRIDPLSALMGVHNRVDWASLEADLGNLELARSLLEGGLEAHPRSAPLLVTLAKVERLEGRYANALKLVRQAQDIAGSFNVPAMTERSQVLRALGEREMAANLARHVDAVKALNRMKQQGYWGSEAWRAFIEATRSAEQQAVVVAARARKQQLGWAPTVRGGKPQPTGQAGDGRRSAAPEAQQWLQLEQLRLRRAEARRIAAQRAARMRAMEEGEDEGGSGSGSGGDPGGISSGLAPPGASALLGSRSSGDDDFNDFYDEPPVGVPSLDSVRRPMPGDEDVYDT
ncbi:hypothetical protein VaNZ11_001819 [Volvox africanus]|uniref:FHA domain-containing protein n=1 Tax=Volvox africanus TaxID=51714 RepID=A0ABQ5RQI6_9CHLO|nr:hypothetical protein VaNZ11_001819 [Volvox africanus]